MQAERERKREKGARVLKPKLHQIEAEAEGRGHQCREAVRLSSLSEAKPNHAPQTCKNKKRIANKTASVMK